MGSGKGIVMVVQNVKANNKSQKTDRGAEEIEAKKGGKSHLMKLAKFGKVNCKTK